MAAAYGFILLLMLCFCSNLVSAKDFEDLGRANSWSYITLINHTIGIPKEENGTALSYPVFAKDYEELEGEDSWNSKILGYEQEVMNPDDENGKALSYPGCGFRTPKIQENNSQTRGSRKGGLLINDDDEAEEHSWPWMVAIYNTGKKIWNITKPLSCGASLISRKYVLSAAHCFGGPGGKMKTDPSIWSVVVGASDFLSDGTKYPVSRILIHPNYTKPGFQHNDIALIEFEIPVELSKRVYPVCLPSTGLTDKIEANKLEVVETGWRRRAHDGDISHVLKEIRIFPILLEKCKTLLKNVIKKQFCAGGTIKEKEDAPCRGDSGGPMVYELEDNSYVQVGIGSYGFRCPRHGSPSVYTRVSEYTKWIYDNSDLGK